MRIALALMLWLVSANALACKCMPLSARDLYNKSNTVFVATAVAGTPSPRKEGDIARVKVLRSLKGSAAIGSIVKIDPAAGSDCEVRFLSHAHLLVFADVQHDGVIMASACSVRLAEPIKVDNHVLKPGRDVIKLLSSPPDQALKLK